MKSSKKAFGAFSLLLITVFSGEVIAQKTSTPTTTSVASTKLDVEETGNLKTQKRVESVPSPFDVSSKRKLDASVKRKPIQRSSEMLERKKIEPKLTDPLH